MLEGINYLHAKFQINILRNKKVIKLLELWTLWLKRKEKRKENSEYKRVVITTLKKEKLLFALVMMYTDDYGSSRSIHDEEILKDRTVMQLMQSKSGVLIRSNTNPFFLLCKKKRRRY